MRLTCDYPAIGVNHSLKIRGNRLYKTKERKAFDKFCSTLRLKFSKSECYEVVINVYKPKFVTQKGLASKNAGDVDGFIKPILDEVFNKSGVDDSQIFKVTCNKIPSDSDMFSIEVFPMTLPEKENMK